MRICVKKVGALKRRLHYRAVTSPHFYKWWVVDHVSAVLDRQLLGEHIAYTCDEYLVLEDGRIIQFEL